MLCDLDDDGEKRECLADVAWKLGSLMGAWCALARKGRTFDEMRGFGVGL